MGSTRLRSITKAITYRLSSTLLFGSVVLLVLYLVKIITGFVVPYKFGITGGVMVIELIIKMPWFYVHERIWKKIKWGKINGKHKRLER